MKGIFWINNVLLLSVIFGDLNYLYSLILYNRINEKEKRPKSDDTALKVHCFLIN